MNGLKTKNQRTHTHNSKKKTVNKYQADSID